jgi:hypothetical protein
MIFTARTGDAAFGQITMLTGVVFVVHRTERAFDCRHY